MNPTPKGCGNKKQSRPKTHKTPKNISHLLMGLLLQVVRLIVGMGLSAGKESYEK